MTLSELRAQLRDNLFDDGAALTDTQATRFVNAAMQHIINWASAAEPSLLAYRWTGTIANPGFVNLRVLVTPTVYTKVRRILEAERTNLSGDDAPGLEIIEFSATRAALRGSPQTKPAVFLYGQQLGFLEPDNNIGVRIEFVPYVPDMTASTDTPGQAAGIGTANLLPVSHQFLIPTYAAILALTAEARDTRDWQAIYAEQRAELTGSWTARKRSPERP